MILAPIVIRRKTDVTKDPDDSGQQAPQTITLFKSVHVFDYSQTEGPPSPSIIKATGDATALYPALEEAVKRAGILIEVVESIPGSHKAEAPPATEEFCSEWTSAQPTH